jgi:hypothetical protein
MSDTAGAARGKGAAYPSGAPEIIPGFEWGSCYSIFSFVCCYVDHRLCVVVFFYFGHGVICPSIFDVLNAPLVCSTLFYVNIFVPYVLGELCKINRIILNVWCKYHFINIFVQRKFIVLKHLSLHTPECCYFRPLLNKILFLTELS